MKSKIIIEVEFEENKLPQDWQKYLKEFYQSQDEAMIPFGQESRKKIKINKIEIKEDEK